MEDLHLNTPTQSRNQLLHTRKEKKCIHSPSTRVDEQMTTPFFGRLDRLNLPRTRRFGEGFTKIWPVDGQNSPSPEGCRLPERPSNLATLKHTQGISRGFQRVVSYKLYLEYVDLGTLPTSPSSDQPQEVLGAKTENAGSGHDTKKIRKTTHSQVR